MKKSPLDTEIEVLSFVQLYVVVPSVFVVVKITSLEISPLHNT